MIAAVGFWATGLARIGWRCGCPCAFRACRKTPLRARFGWGNAASSGGQGPEMDIPAFLDCRDPEKLADKAEPFGIRPDGWLDLMAQAADLHPITRACMGFHLWSLVGLGQQGDRMEAAATAVRIAQCRQGGSLCAAVYGWAGGAVRWRPPCRAATPFDGQDGDCLPDGGADLDNIEPWAARAVTEMALLAGKTPPNLRTVLTDWPLVSAPMAMVLTGASRAAIQRNFAWMEARGLIREVTGQGRYRMWRIASQSVAAA